ncbi:MAG: hypothetical protein VW831_10095 [Gammaproteobacteria bacterium]
MKQWPKHHLLIVMTTLAVLAGCGSDPGFNEDTDFVRTEGAVQVINMMSDSPELTFIHGLNSSPVRFPYTSGVEVRVSDNYDWRAAYLNSDGDEVTVIEGVDQVVSEDVQSTFLLMGNLAQPTAQIVDIPLTPLDQRPETEAEVWFAASLTEHAMVDIYLTEFGTALTAVAPLVTLDSSTYSSLRNVPAGDNRQLRITPAGASDILFDSGAIVIAAQSLELFALVDDFGPSNSSHIDVIRSLAANLTTITDVSQPPAAQVANLTTITPLDVSVGSIDYESLAAGEVSAYRTVASGSQVITTTGPAGTTASETPFLPAGQYLSVVVVDDVGAEAQPASRIAVVETNLRPVQDRAHFQLVNSSDVTIDFYALREDESTDDIAPTFNDLATGVTGVIEVLTGQARFIAQTADNASDIDSVTADLMAGKSYTVVFDGQQRLTIIED